MNKQLLLRYQQIINYLAVDYYESKSITPTQEEIEHMECQIIQHLYGRDKRIEQLQAEVKDLQLALKQSQRLRKQQVILLCELRNQQGEINYKKKFHHHASSTEISYGM